MAESLETKQQYLRTEILDLGFDPEEFSEFMCTQRGGENVDLETWTLQDLQKIVQLYKEKKKTESQPQPEQEPSLPSTEPATQEAPKEMTQSQTLANQQVAEGSSTEINADNLSPKAMIAEIKDKIKDGDPFVESSELIDCVKLEPNEITDREDLSIVVCNPTKKKEKVFSFSYYTYTVKTDPMNYNVERKLADFQFIYQKLPLLNPGVFNPLLPVFQIGLKDDSPKKLLYLQEYMNSLIEIKYFRSLPIIFDFLTLPLDQWLKIRKEKYEKIKALKQYSDIQNLNGRLTLKINKETDEYATKIKEDINQKEDIFKDINSNFDDLLETFKKMSEIFNNLSVNFNKLQKKYSDNEVLSKIFTRFDLLFNQWNKDYKKQNAFFRNEVKYFFKFMNKENLSFVKNYDLFKSARDDYKKYFEKMRKGANPSIGDLNLYIKSKKDYGFNLVQINEEYKNLGERQGKRALKQLNVYEKSKSIIFQDLENCLKILNIKENWDKNIEEEIKKSKEEEPNEVISKDLSDGE